MNFRKQILTILLASFATGLAGCSSMEQIKANIEKKKAARKELLSRTTTVHSTGKKGTFYLKGTQFVATAKNGTCRVERFERRKVVESADIKFNKHTMGKFGPVDQEFGNFEVTYKHWRKKFVERSRSGEFVDRFRWTHTCTFVIPKGFDPKEEIGTAIVAYRKANLAEGKVLPNTFEEAVIFLEVKTEKELFANVPYDVNENYYLLNATLGKAVKKNNYEARVNGNKVFIRSRWQESKGVYKTFEENYLKAQRKGQKVTLIAKIGKVEITKTKERVLHFNITAIKGRGLPKLQRKSKQRGKRNYSQTL